MNKVILMGRLTKDPEIRYTGTGEPIAIARYTIAVNRPYKKDGQTQADFINVVSYRKAAEFIEKYFKKGQMIAIVGRLQVRSWDDSEGKRHWSTEVITDEIHFAGGKNENGSATPAAPAAPQTAAAAPQSGVYPPADSGFYPVDESIEDDNLPF